MRWVDLLQYQKNKTAGFTLGVKEIKGLLAKDEIKYLSEMMNFPGVIFEDKEVMQKLQLAKDFGKPVDGHAPGLRGEDLEKYVGAGISTDHECFTIDEAREKISLGMKVQIREGSAAKNFESLYMLIDEYPDEVMICSDDIHPDDLVKGHIDRVIKLGIKNDVNIFNLIRAVTLNPVKHYNLDVGLLQENDPADLIVIDNFDDFNVLSTYIDGNLVYDGENVLFDSVDEVPVNNFNCREISLDDIIVPGKQGDKINVIEALEGELITNGIVLNANIYKDQVMNNIGDDVLKIVVYNRYFDSKPSVAFIKGFGFRRGAIASSIAHDSHNIIAIGANDGDLVKAINILVDHKGGISTVDKEDISVLPLNIGGIITNSDVNEVATKYEYLNKKAIEFGTLFKAPFMTLSFMALLVIPSLKISDKGLFNGSKFEFTDVIV